MFTPANDFERRRTLFSLLWIFLMFNYLYADVIGLMDASILRQYLTGTVEGLTITPTFLLMAALLMEVPIAMTVLPHVLPARANRFANIAAGLLKFAAVGLSLCVGTPTAYYLFFAVIELTVSLFIVVWAWQWRPVGVSATA